MKSQVKKPPIQTTFHKSYKAVRTSPSKKGSHASNMKWYEAHDKDRRGETGITHKQAERDRYIQVHEHMLDGILAEAPGAEKEVTDNVMFVSPLKVKEPTQRGAVYHDLAKSTKFKCAVHTLQKYDKTDRWGCGLNANTLMTEYRRKVLFHALLNSGDVDEKREDAQEKVKRFLHINFPEEMSEEDKEHMEKEKAELLQMEQNLRVKDRRQKVHIQETDFHPRYDDYDVMRNRWSYLRPQLTSFIDRKDLIPNTTSRISSTTQGVSVKGNVEDILRFEDQQREAEERAMKKMAASQASHSSGGSYRRK